MAKNIRFQGLVKTTAQLESDKFAGRIGWNSTLARFVAYYSSTLYAQMARRDVLETFAEGLQDSTLDVGLPMFAGTSGRISTESVASFRTRIGAQDASDAVVKAPSAGQVIGAQPLQVSYGVRATNYDSSKLNAMGGVGAELSCVNPSTTPLARVMGYDRTNAVRIPVAMDGSIIQFLVGGTEAGAFDALKNFSINGVQRISAGGAGSLTTLATTGLATVQSLNISGLTGSRMLSLDASKNVVSLDAAASRALIGAQAEMGDTDLYRIFSGGGSHGGTTEAAFASYTIPANTLTSSNMEVVAEVFGRIEQGSTSDTLTVRFKIAGTIITSIVRTGAFNKYIFRAVLKIKTNISNCRVMGELFTDGDTVPTLIFSDGLIAFSATSAQTFDVTAQTGAGNGAAYLMSMRVWKQAP